MAKIIKYSNASLFNESLSILTRLILLIAILCQTAVAEQSSKQESLTFLTWSEYIAPEIVSEFEQQFNAKINFIFYETDDARDNAMVDNNGQGFDLILVSGLMLNQYIQRGWLDTIDYNQIQNVKHLHNRWLTEKKNKYYQVPYFWGSLGLAYRKDLVKEKLTHWKQVFKPDQSLKGKILMINNAREVTALALKSLGYSGNSNELKQIREAGALLMAQKPYVQKYSYMTLTDKSPLITGEISVSMVYSGDALFLRDKNPNIVYVLPEEGGIIWTDYLTIGKGSRKKELALKFINFINTPKIAARNATFVYYATPNKSAEEHLTPEFLNDPVIYPDKEDSDRLELLDDLSSPAQRLINSIMLNLIDQ